jgi:hypothetical protein
MARILPESSRQSVKIGAAAKAQAAVAPDHGGTRPGAISWNVGY